MNGSVVVLECLRSANVKAVAVPAKTNGEPTGGEFPGLAPLWPGASTRVI